MRFFRVMVNGTSYDIEVEEITKEPIPKDHNGQLPKPSASIPQLAVISSDHREDRRKNIENGAVKSPMPGIIGAIMKAVGDTVESGETIMLLEAMKLENDIMAPKNGVICKINVSKGQSVNTGELLAEIE